MQLPYIRFVKQVSNGGSFSKYGYIELMQRNAKAIQTAPWRQAKCAPNEVTLTVNQLTRTDGVADEETGLWTSLPSYTAWLDDRCDAFAQAGDAVSRAGTMCGYTGCVAYRFTLPNSSPSAMTSLSLALQRDRYLRAGVRIALQFSDDPTPSDDWDGVIHPSASSATVHVSPSTAAEEGTVGVQSWGVMGQPDIPYLLAGRAAGGSYAITDSDFAAMAAAASSTYLYVYITLEDGAGYWEMYSASEPRYYYIEGSAVLVPAQCEFGFADSASVVGETWISSLPKPMEAARDVMMHAIVDRSEVVAHSPDGFRMVPMAGIIVPSGDLPSVAATTVRHLSAFPHRPLHAPHGSVEVAGNGQSGSNVWGYPGAFIRLTAMNRFGGWPCEVGGNSCGLFVLVRKAKSGDTGYTMLSDPNDTTRTFLAFDGGVQLCFGCVPYIVPPDKPNFSKMKIGGGAEQFTQQGCAVSLNVWKSTSKDCFGEFSNVAMVALMQNPEFFTGEKEIVSGSASVEMYNPSETDTHTVCETVSVTASANLIANVDASPLLTGDLTVEGLNLLPGDFIIIAPKVDSVIPSVSIDDPVATGRSTPIFFGRPSTVDVPIDLAQITPYPFMGGCPTAYFA